MPKLSSYKRIVTNDYKEDNRKLVEQIAQPINDSFNELYFAVNGRLSLRENTFATVKDVEVTVNANGIPVTPTSFSLDKQGQLIGTQIILAVNQINTAAYPTAAPFASVTQNGLGVAINHISGLQPGQRYVIRIVAYLG